MDRFSAIPGGDARESYMGREVILPAARLGERGLEAYGDWEGNIDGQVGKILDGPVRGRCSPRTKAMTIDVRGWRCNQAGSKRAKV
jgi:hypothetical protein